MKRKIKDIKNMELKEAILILEQHNKWRKGNDDKPMVNPNILGKAIDLVLKQVKNIDNPQSNGVLPCASGSSLPLKIERIIAVVAQRWGKDYGGSTVGILRQDAIDLCEQYGIDWGHYC